MGKALKSWSGMRRYLEKEMLALPLRGKVRYDCTTCVGMDGCRLFEVYLDGEIFKRFSWETVNSWFISEGLVEKPEKMLMREYWTDFWPLLDRYPMNERTEYTDGEFAEALERYRQSDIRESLSSEDPIVKMFALLDRRTGRRTLEKLAGSIEAEPEWVRKVYEFRMQAGI